MDFTVIRRCARRRQASGTRRALLCPLGNILPVRRGAGGAVSAADFAMHCDYTGYVHMGAVGGTLLAMRQP